jgi:hypothetical protein
MTTRPRATRLADVGFGGTTAVELVGVLSASEGLASLVAGKCVAYRTDVGFSVEEPAKGDPDRTVTVFYPVQTEVRAAQGLRLESEGGHVELRADDLQLDGLVTSSTTCHELPVGFEGVMDSPHAARGRLTRRDQWLMQGDRVELVGHLEPTPGGGFRTAGVFSLHDLSTGGLTQHQRRKRSARSLTLFLALAVLVGVGMCAVAAGFP